MAINYNNMQRDGGGDQTFPDPRRPFDPNLPDGGVDIGMPPSGGNNGGGGTNPNPDPDTFTFDTDKDVFFSTLNSIFGVEIGNDILDELYSVYSEYYKAEDIDPRLIPQMIIGRSVGGKELTPLFNKQFASYLTIVSNKENKTGITSLLDYIEERNAFKNVMTAYGVGDLATNENINKFFEGNVSVLEAQTRMEAAFQAIQSADTLLRQQLGDLNLSGRDLARALILGKEGANELTSKIKTANIRAAEVESGISSMLGAGELAMRGVTRDEALRGLSTTRTQMPGYQAEAVRQGITTQDLQKELESENILGMASQRRRRIQQGAASRFQGTSGTSGNVSLGRSSAGAF